MRHAELPRAGGGEARQQRRLRQRCRQLECRGDCVLDVGRPLSFPPAHLLTGLVGSQTPAPSSRTITKGTSAPVSSNALLIGVVWPRPKSAPMVRLGGSEIWSPGLTTLVSIADHFIRCLLEEDPKRRMTMKEALQHPWLSTYTPFYGSSSLAGSPKDPSRDSDDGSFRSSMSEGFQNLNIQGSYTDPTTSGEGTSGIRREDSRTGRLQRRSDLLSRAAEEGKAMLEPSQEMVANASSQEARAAGTSTAATKGQNKRVYSELTPLPEDVPMEGGSGGSSPLSEVDSLYRKSSDEDASGKKEAGRMARGKGKAVSTTAKKSTRSRARGDVGDDDAAQPRRSGRHPQKVARRT